MNKTKASMAGVGRGRRVGQNELIMQEKVKFQESPLFQERLEMYKK